MLKSKCTIETLYPKIAAISCIPYGNKNNEIAKILMKSYDEYEEQPLFLLVFISIFAIL